MRVLKNNYKPCIQKEKQNYPQKCICENCESELEYDKSDINIGEYGCAFVKCPVCGIKTAVDLEEDEFKLTQDNVEFPLHFNHICTPKSKDYFTNENIKHYIKEYINYLRKSGDYYCGGWITGNLFLSVTKLSEDEQYIIYTSNDFYETMIPFGKEDYKH